MRNNKKMIFKMVKPVYTVAFLILFYTVGVLGLISPSFHDLFVKLTPLSLLLSFILLMLYNPGWNHRLVVFALLVYLFGFLFEAIGVNTGLIFGEYTYGSVLGIKIWNTPLMIGVNWLILVYSTWDLVRRIRMSIFLHIFIAALIMVVFDIFLEPVAIKMGMWTWVGEEIPFKNYIAWFVISILFFGLAAILKLEIRNRLSFPLWCILFAFFILLNLINI